MIMPYEVLPRQNLSCTVASQRERSSEMSKGPGFLRGLCVVASGCWLHPLHRQYGGDGEDLPQGLKPALSAVLSAKAKALAYLEAKQNDYRADENVLVHAFHTAAAVAVSAAGCFLLLRDVGDDGFGGEEQA